VTTNKKETSLFNFENSGASIFAASTNVGGFDFIPAQSNRSIDAEADLSCERSGGMSFVANELISQGTSRSASFANCNDYGDYHGLAFYNNKYFYIRADNSNSPGDNANDTRSSPDLCTAKVIVAAPTIASATVSGRVFTPTGRGLGNASVVMTNQNGESVRARTNPFGYYRFADIQSGEIYIFSVASKHYQFATQVVNVAEDLDG
jgi:Carboxypeptidase regulatory-like domain